MKTTTATEVLLARKGNAEQADPKRTPPPEPTEGNDRNCDCKVGIRKREPQLNGWVGELSPTLFYLL